MMALPISGVRDLRGQRGSRRLPAEGGAEPRRRIHPRRLRLRRRGRHTPPDRVQKGQAGQDVSKNLTTEKNNLAASSKAVFLSVLGKLIYG